MTRNRTNETLAAQMRREFADARAEQLRAEFLAMASPFEVKLDAFLAKVDTVLAKALAWLIGPSPTPAAEDALSS